MMKTWAITDTGLVRKENQDTYRISESNRVCVVCDGMGGAAGGCVASNLAAETYLSELEKVLKEDMTPEQLREINLRIYNTHYAIMEAVLAHDPDGADRAVAAMVRLFQDTVH